MKSRRPSEFHHSNLVLRHLVVYYTSARVRSTRQDMSRRRMERFLPSDEYNALRLIISFAS
jgi:hypothetical protein